MEGSYCYKKGCDYNVFVVLIIEYYYFDGGCLVIGGYVYWGESLKSL